MKTNFSLLFCLKKQKYYISSNAPTCELQCCQNLKNLGKVIHIALVNSWVLIDPFLGYKGKSKNVERYYLNQRKTQQLIDKVFVAERLGQVRDVFKLTAYHVHKRNDYYTIPPEKQNLFRYPFLP